MSDEDRQNDSDWLKDAFERALRGDNGVAPDAARPAANPFGVTPTPEQEEPVRHNELDLDFETESTVPPQAFLPVVDFGDDEPVDDSEPDPFAVFARPDEVSSLEDLPTEAIDTVDLPEFDVPNLDSQTLDSPPTEAIDLVDAPTVVATPADPAPTEALDGIESLFGDDRFADAPTAAIGTAAPATVVMERESTNTESTNTQPAARTRTGIPRNVLILGGAAFATVALSIAAFVLGSTLGGSTGSPEPVATDDAEATATREPGTWAWNQMFGGECVDPFPGAWAESFDVVDCATPHAAQLVAVGDLAEQTGGTFPGVDQSAALAEAACSAQGVLDLATAGAYPNIQINVAYPVTAEQWDSGETSFYCFVSLADASPITGSVAGTGVSADITE